MMLRTKLLALLTLLAVGPLVAIGIIGYALSMRAVATQLETQTSVLADRSAEEIARRVRLVESDLLLIGENAESERVLRLREQRGAPVGEAAALRDASAYLESAWELLGRSYSSIELRDAAGAPVHRLGSAGPVDPMNGRVLEYTVTARAPDDGRPLGSVHALVHLEALLPLDALDARFGRGGITAVVHRSTGQVLHLAGGEPRTARRAGDLGLDAATLAARTDAGPVRTGDGTATRIGWVTPLPEPPLTVVSLAEREEFAAPFRGQATAQLLIVLLLAAAVIPAGMFLIRRATRSLEDLTVAADRVGRGDFNPELPPAGNDEVGRLTAGFTVMTSEVRRMVAEIERSRQLAAIGEFAAELSHEIRNPLTAVKLNLQRVQRLIESRSAPVEAEKPVRIALSEIGRLDRVVRSVLRLGRTPTDRERREIAVRDLITRAIEPLREQFDARDITMLEECERSWIQGDQEELAGALLNLLLNAMEAMPAGGTLRVRCVEATADDGRWVDIHVSDTGTGMPEEARARLFRPFVTTKPDGTGLGLALALRAAEAHGGTITLVRSSPAGTEFRLRLPLAPAPVPA